MTTAPRQLPRLSGPAAAPSDLIRPDHSPAAPRPCPRPAAGLPGEPGRGALAAGPAGSLRPALTAGAGRTPPSDWLPGSMVAERQVNLRGCEGAG